MPIKNKKYIILNFLHGNSPYLRTIEMALAVNDELEKRGMERMGIIIPLVYKERQKEIIKHNFRHYLKKYPDELLLDEKLGEYLWSIFYNGDGFDKWLDNFLKKEKGVTERIKNYLNKGLSVENLSGKKFSINKKNIAIEINRCPLVSFDIKPSYFASFGYMSDILERSILEDGLDLDKNVLKNGIKYFEDLEKKQTVRFIAEPATFSYLDNWISRHDSEIFTPPNTNQKLNLNFLKNLFLKRGIYVTITGVYGLSRLFEEIQKTGLKIYTHKLGVIPSGKKALPDIIMHKNILLHFARIGWGSAWLSFMTETPLITFPYDFKDDPEVYFNNICIEKLGIGKVYKGESLEQLLAFGEEYKNKVKLIKQDLIKKYGTINGVEYTAQKIADHYLS
ncbi:hypothetical protein KJ763_01085 [Patescibacteria group bacterium]|nr:hypothetical protein [Patescibacteria group bacterium]